MLRGKNRQGAFRLAKLMEKNPHVHQPAWMKTLLETPTFGPALLGDRVRTIVPKTAQLEKQISRKTPQHVTRASVREADGKTYRHQAEKLAHLTHAWMSRGGLDEQPALWAATRQLEREQMLAKMELQLARQQAEDAGFRQVLLGPAEAVFKQMSYETSDEGLLASLLGSLRESAVELRKELSAEDPTLSMDSADKAEPEHAAALAEVSAIDKILEAAQADASDTELLDLCADSSEAAEILAPFLLRRLELNVEEAGNAADARQERARLDLLWIAQREHLDVHGTCLLSTLDRFAKAAQTKYSLDVLDSAKPLDVLKAYMYDTAKRRQVHIEADGSDGFKIV